MRLSKFIVHLGLPKTGTTALQRHFFSLYPGYLGIAKDGRSPAQNLSRLYESAPEKRWRGLQEWCEANAVAADLVLVSNEALANWMAPNSWPLSRPIANRPRPHPSIAFLKQLQDSLGPWVELRVIVSFRKQSDFLGSMYAQSWRNAVDAGQEDFDSRLARLVASEDNALNWGLFLQELFEAFGNSRVLGLIFEKGLDRNAAAIEEFIGVPASGGATHFPLVNSRSQEFGAWKVGGEPVSWRHSWPAKVAQGLPPYSPARKLLRKVASQLDQSTFKWQSRLTPDRCVRINELQQAEIMEVYSEGNRLLERLLGENLRRFGY